MARRRPRRHEDGRLAVHRERKPYRVDVVGRSAGRLDEGSSPPDPNLRLYPGRGKGFAMTKLIATLPWVLGLCLALSPAPTQAIDFGGLAKKASGTAASGARDKAVKEVNAKLLAEGRKNQCSFKTDSDELAGRRQEAPQRGGCDQLQVRGFRSHRFERQARAQQGAVGQTRRGHRA